MSNRVEPRFTGVSRANSCTYPRGNPLEPRQNAICGEGEERRDAEAAQAAGDAVSRGSASIASDGTAEPSRAYSQDPQPPRARTEAQASFTRVPSDCTSASSFLSFSWPFSTRALSACCFSGSGGGFL